MDRSFRVLVGTPAGGGQVSVHWFLSMMNVFRAVHDIKHQIFIRDNLRAAAKMGMINEQNSRQLEQLEAMNLVNWEIGLYTLSNESLLSRGRNHIGAVALRGRWDKLFFIDADAQFTWEQFKSVALAPYDLCAGACPLKCLPINLNFLPFEEDEHYFKQAIRSVESFVKLRDGHKTQYVPVAFIGTAFMAISRKLLLASAENTEEYQYPNPSTGFMHTHWNMFDTKPMHGKYMSEDWSFCKRARDLGFQVMMDTNVIIDHVGTLIYTPEMHSLQMRTTPDTTKPQAAS